MRTIGRRALRVTEVGVLVVGFGHLIYHSQIAFGFAICKQQVSMPMLVEGWTSPVLRLPLLVLDLMRRVTAKICVRGLISLCDT